jgi:hypothetical protein
MSGNSLTDLLVQKRLNSKLDGKEVGVIVKATFGSL